jgi:hypothetical protein
MEMDIARIVRRARTGDANEGAAQCCELRNLDTCGTSGRRSLKAGHRASHDAAIRFNAKRFSVTAVTAARYLPVA